MFQQRVTAQQISSPTPAPPGRPNRETPSLGPYQGCAACQAFSLNPPFAMRAFTNFLTRPLGKGLLG